MTDIGFVHIDVQFHLGQILGQCEQHRGLKGGRHGLTGLDTAGQDNAVDRRADNRFGKIGLGGFKGCLGLGNRGLGAGFISLGPFKGRLGRIEFSL